MAIVDAGSLYKHGGYLADKSDLTMIAAFEAFYSQAETTTGQRIH